MKVSNHKFGKYEYDRAIIQQRQQYKRIEETVIIGREIGEMQKGVTVACRAVLSTVVAPLTWQFPVHSVLCLIFIALIGMTSLSINAPRSPLGLVALVAHKDVLLGLLYVCLLLVIFSTPSIDARLFFPVKRWFIPCSLVSFTLIASSAITSLNTFVLPEGELGIWLTSPEPHVAVSIAYGVALLAEMRRLR